MTDLAFVSKPSKQAVWRPIITIWGGSLCLLAGLIVGVSQAPAPERLSENGPASMRAEITGNQNISGAFGYGRSSPAVERVWGDSEATNPACEKTTRDRVVQRATPAPRRDTRPTINSSTRS